MDEKNSGWVILLIIAVILVIVTIVAYVQQRETGVSTWVWVLFIIAIFIGVIALVVYFRESRGIHAHDMSITTVHHHSISSEDTQL